MGRVWGDGGVHVCVSGVVGVCDVVGLIVQHGVELDTSKQLFECKIFRTSSVISTLLFCNGQRPHGLCQL